MVFRKKKLLCTTVFLNRNHGITGRFPIKDAYINNTKHVIVGVSRNVIAKRIRILKTQTDV